MSGGPLIVYAFVVGLTGLINPCALPLLPAYLTFFLDDTRRPWPVRLLSALRSGGCLTAGFVTVFALTGMVEASLATAATAFAPWLMLLVGGAIVALGILSLIGKAPGFHLPGLSFRSGTGVVAMVGFGVAYAVGSLSCSLPIFVAAVGSALSASDPLQSVAIFVAYALGMGLFATTASVIAAFGGAVVLRVFRPAARVLPRIAGGLCVLVGVYLLAYWAHQLGAPDVLAVIVAGVESVQAALVSWFDAWWIPSAVICCAVVIGALTTLAMPRRRSWSPRPAPSRDEHR